MIFPNFQNRACCEEYLKGNEHNSLHLRGYLSLDIVCSSKIAVFPELRSRKTARFSEQIMSADKYPSIFPRQMEAIVYELLTNWILILSDTNCSLNMA